MEAESRARARDEVLFHLKTGGPQTAGEISECMGVTAVAVRQHLATLADEGLVEFADERRPVGRPAHVWKLTPEAAGHFPDAHSDLALELLEAARRGFGDKGLQKLLTVRSRTRLARYRRFMPPSTARLEERVRTLAALRGEAGNLAEWCRDKDGGFLLIENHCPIAAAAQVCPDLCTEELGIFRTVLGKDVFVEMTEHMLGADRRCVFAIRPRARRTART
jgi:predicted ArsR family transcriptional regulator